ncbi:MULTISPECIES: phosphoribosylamine--glycine ligase [unclassified Bacillus (in: firmicutes)]|uniref:phosphoribosylamine--glycine ligase n=1 Tax=unclassified Bacillus (in: firmicutes) TaxID=185979 RepID=UPI0008EB4357|nr:MULTISPECIES: phosphoribosylamine--glycine ligase [unclassified Bacillus (in: firmicutes)]SFB23588.1 phosphoribosylamine--glycine ligase [Bacillus sp. UNCCL13]SFQ87841.1 phosphoribosylamine--glycine ligase [Bacillus sp. cl95]
MNILVIGRGGREHAICRKLKESKSVHEVFAAPGNDGMSEVAINIGIAENEHDKLLAFAKENHVGLTIIGPEMPLLEGLADKFRLEGLDVFAPNQAAAMIEGSKAFAKDLMKRYDIPTASYDVFDNFDVAKEYIETIGAPIVIKADGVAAGKGVVVAFSKKEAIESLEDMMLNNKFGNSADRVVIEEYLEGEEFSLMAFVNGDIVIPLEIAQDHKRAFDGDLGPNTGGMGAYSPVPQIGAEAVKESVQTILQPLASALVKEGKTFCGVIFAGLMKTNEGPKVIEFNARFGDPETQVVLPRMKSDLAQVIISLLNGDVPEIEWHNEATLGVVLAAEGYPDSYQSGDVIKGLADMNSETYVFHAGTQKNKEGDFVASGGRILLIGAKGKSVKEAQEKAYLEIAKIKADGMFYRKDIGYRAIGRDVSVFS